MTRDLGVSRALYSEHDVFALRRSAKSAAVAAGLEERDQVRLATALSELGRDLLRPGAPVMASFAIEEQAPPRLRVELAWHDDRDPSEESFALAARLLPYVRSVPRAGAARSGGRIEVACELPEATSARDAAVRVHEALRADLPTITALDDLRAQTRDLAAALEESRAQRDELERLNSELTETNQGVMALYAELSAELEETNRGVVALYGEEHQLALTLQRTFLPSELPQIPRVELAVRYLPAATETEIGGDFYEAVDTPAGLLLAVGDVVGHSLQAAIVMGELRHALRAYAAEEHRPHELLERLDHLMRLHQRGWTATVCVVLVEPGAGVIQVANAGHLPPLLMRPGKQGDYLRDHGPLLGVGLPQPAATVHQVDPGSTVVLITDGLIETRDRDLSERMEDLRVATAAQGAAGPERLCDGLLTVFGAEQEDDMIVFAARLDHSPGETADAAAAPGNA
ncbi:PP2C family protein-serine/threonine phosphatase [Streptomyces sp. IBSBF 2435]|uniref:PP2C family protein-serine/threonine phosphatase n=1 Tax=Streptomyces sp. IBSBF 2435 TaxID=2903531 RepID=UPI002FDC48F6